MSDEYIEKLRNELQDVNLTSEEKDNIVEAFTITDEDQSGFIEWNEIQAAFQATSAKPPQYKVRACLSKYDSNNDQKLSIKEFSAIYSEVCPKSMKNTFEKAIQKKSGIVVAKSENKQSAEGTQHSYSHEERIAFCNWINQNLCHDEDLKDFNLPMDEDDEATFFNSLKDGILLCKLINFSQPDTIDRRVINLKKSSRPQVQIHKDQENLNLALNSASAIGCSIVNIGAQDIKDGRPHLVMGMLWQIIRIGLFSAINLEECPGLAVLLEDGETLEDLLSLPPEQILLRWVNYHLRKSEKYQASPKQGAQINNFSGDIKDSYAYMCLLEQIQPVPDEEDGELLIAANTNANSGTSEDKMLARAHCVLNDADKLECRAFVSEKDIVKGISKLNLAFVANLFNKHPALEAREPPEPIIETREEKTYRNWMNSMGVAPRVNRIYRDLNNGLVYVQLYQQIDRECVNEKRVARDFTKLGGNMKKIENCNYAVELGKNMNLSLVGIDGNDLNTGTQTATLALTWQLMRQYTLAMLKNLMGDELDMKKVDRAIVQWVNEKLAEAGKDCKISNFKDSSLKNSVPILHLCDAMVPNSVNFDLINPDAKDEDELMDNARYAISMCRKIGARVYTLPEDICEGNQKMMMTLFACLMTRDISMEKKNKE